MAYRTSDTIPSWLSTLAVIVGYASFRTANSSIYLSRFAQSPESFIFMTDPLFNIMSALATVLCAAAVVILCARGLLKRFSMPVLPAVAILFCGMATTALPFDGSVLALSVAAFSVGSIMLKMAWIELFACETPRRAIIEIACASLVGAGLQYLLSAVEASVAVVFVALLLAANAVLLLALRRDARAASETETPAALPEKSAHDARRRAFAEISDALLALCVLEAVIGLINSFMLAASMTFDGAASVPSLAMTIAAGLFGFATFVMRRLPAASSAFRVAFPVLAAMVAFVPFASEGYSRLFSTVLLTGYDFVALLLLYQVAYASHKFGVSSYALMALFSGCTKCCLLAALIAGGLFGGQETQEAPATVRFLVLSCGVIYLLAIALIVLSRDRKKRSGRRDGAKGGMKTDTAAKAPGAGKEAARETEPDAADERHDAACETRQVAAETCAPTCDAADPCVSASDTAHEEESAAPHDAIRNGSAGEDPDSFDATCRALALRCGLTGRETEVLGHLARGRTNTRIAEDLCISPATVRGHIRHIYTKLDVHDRQELIDLFQ
ncbi:MAG: LuxR C-terminal-related transcriptional regulator [Slackia sp.]|nr:LuxR C-terminal-related transcriptional regulator [Slackia sp.]